ncbi:MAG TPA: hypothetical protein DCY53_12535 [Desulfobacteraceae bacterium]|nr:hypothetical protein [Desulfobacteraceae bacterium]
MIFQYLPLMNARNFGLHRTHESSKYIQGSTGFAFFAVYTHSMWRPQEDLNLCLPTEGGISWA